MTVRAKMEQFGRYGLIGIASNAFSFGVFLVLLQVGIPPVAASGMVYLLGLTISYLANRRWGFRSKGTHGQDMPRFLAAYGTGLVFSMSFIWLLVHWMHPAIAQIITTFATAVVIYACLTVFRFGQGQKTYAK